MSGAGASPTPNFLISAIRTEPIWSPAPLRIIQRPVSVTCCLRAVSFGASYDWAALLSADRVRKVLNMVATRDWVVALFPMGLEPFRRFFDLGGAGFAGFRQARPRQGREP